MNWTYLEGFGHFLQSTVSVPHPYVLFLLFLNSSQDATFRLACHLVGHSERAFANLFDHIEVFAESVPLLHGDLSDFLCGWV